MVFDVTSTDYVDGIRVEHGDVLNQRHARNQRCLPAKRLSQRANIYAECLEGDICRFLADRYPAEVTCEEICETTGQRQKKVLKLHRNLIKKGLCKKFTESHPVCFVATELLFRQYGQDRESSSSRDKMDDSDNGGTEMRSMVPRTPTLTCGNCLPPPLTVPRAMRNQKKQQMDTWRSGTMLQAPPETMIQQTPRWVIPKPSRSVLQRAQQPPRQPPPQPPQQPPQQLLFQRPVQSTVHRTVQSRSTLSRQLHGSGEQKWPSQQLQPYPQGRMLNRGWNPKQPTTMVPVSMPPRSVQPPCQPQPRRGRYVLPLMVVRKNRPQSSSIHTVPERRVTDDAYVEGSSFPDGLWNHILHESRSLRAVSSQQGKSMRIPENSETPKGSRRQRRSNNSIMLPSPRRLPVTADGWTSGRVFSEVLLPSSDALDDRNE